MIGGINVEASMMNEIAKYLLIFLSLTLAYSILIMFGGRKIFKKANQKETTIFYPILNLFTMLDITDTTIFLGQDCKIYDKLDRYKYDN